MFSLHCTFLSSWHFIVICIPELRSFVHTGPLVLCTSDAVSEFMLCSFIFTSIVLVYTREGARVIWGYIDRILGQPSLIRESSRGKYPWSGMFSRAMSSLSRRNDPGSASKSGNGFGDVILHPSLQKRIEQLSSATANTKAHQAPFRNMLFYGPPGTGKTMAARELARKSVCFMNQ